MEISKNTKLTISISTIVACAVVIWQAAVVADEYRDMIVSNAEAVQLLTKSLRLSRLDDEIADLRKERRDLKREMVYIEDIDLLAEVEDQIEEINDDLDHLTELRKCVVEAEGRVCE